MFICPFRKVTVRPGTAIGRSPGTTIPTRFNGSAAAIVTSSDAPMAPALTQTIHRLRQRKLLSTKAR